MLVFVVDTNFIVQDGVEAHIAEIRDRLHRVQILEITVPERQDGTAGPKHLFPKMWKRRGCSVRVNSNLLLRRCDQRSQTKYQNEASVPHTSITACLWDNLTSTRASLSQVPEGAQNVFSGLAL